jgi:hypothetical protein
MPMSWCELVDAMRERRLEWNADRPWDPEGRFVAPDAEAAGAEAPRTVDEALRSLPPFRPGTDD